MKKLIVLFAIIVMAVALNAQLFVSTSPNTPSQTIIDAGSTGVDFWHVTMRADQNTHLNNITVNHVFPNITPDNVLTNIRVFIGNTQYGSTAQGFDQWNQAYINNINIVIPANDSIEVRFVADIEPIYGNLVSVSALQITQNQNISATDDFGNSVLPYGEFPITGNYMQINNLSEIQFYIDSADTLFVLPGEQWYAQYGIRSHDNTPIIAVEAWLYWMNLSISPQYFVYWWNDDYFNIGETYYEQNGYRSCHYQWIANSGEGTPWWWLFSMEDINTYPPGNQSSYSFHLTVGTNDLQTHYLYQQKEIVTVDRIRGNVNDDGISDSTDVDLIMPYTHSTYNMTHRYTESGLNYGGAIVMFPIPGDIISKALINIHAHNPADSILVGLGIGQLMSETAYNSPVLQTRENTQQIIGNTLSIYTTGNIVDVNTKLENGEPWRYTGFVENGCITIPIPDSSLEYRVDTRYWQNAGIITGIDDPITPPAEIYPILQQNFPNPFNPETKISYSLPKSGSVEINIYNVKGQLIKTLENSQKATGDHNVNWNGTDTNGKPVPAGMYFYKMTAGKFSSTKKMVLLK